MISFFRLSSQHFPFLHACYMPHPSHPWFDHPNIWLKVQIMEHLISQCSPAHYHFTLLLGPYIPLSTLFSVSLSLCPFRNVRYQVSCPYQTSKIIVLWNMFVIKYYWNKRKLQVLYIL
jgi:hypothetical protein